MGFGLYEKLQELVLPRMHESVDIILALDYASRYGGKRKNAGIRLNVMDVRPS